MPTRFSLPVELMFQSHMIHSHVVSSTHTRKLTHWKKQSAYMMSDNNNIESPYARHWSEQCVSVCSKTKILCKKNFSVCLFELEICSLDR